MKKYFTIMLAAISLLTSLITITPASQQSARQHRSTGSKANGSVPTPRAVLGFTPGDDRNLASWEQIVGYFKRLAATSNRVRFQEIGKTTLGRPFVYATISSPANLANLEQYKEIQRKLADPRTFNSNDTEADKLIAQGKTIVLITCGIHSTEVGGNLVSMNIAYRLASDDSPETQEILERCIVLLVPSLNPDGNDIVKNWYDKTLGTPAEGTNPPEIYHHYTGHDNNRDWYAFTQVETQLTVDKIHNVWHPQIVHDIHQQGETGSRFFLPPYVEPWEPNIPPLIQAGVNFMGTTMAWDLAGEGKAGVVINGVYDAWTPARAYQHYHGGIRILSETASARIASPTNVPFEKLTTQVNVDPKVRSWNFPIVWPGGEWKLANIVDYMQSGAFALMRNAARYRERWLRDFYLVGKDAVRARKSDEHFAIIIPPPNGADQASRFWQSSGLEAIKQILTRGGVEYFASESAFDADGKMYPRDTIVIPMAQPYGAFARTLLERQHYPDLRQFPGGPPIRPYDVTAHTLPLLMGVDAIKIQKPFSTEPKGPDPFSRDTGVAPRKSGARVGVYKSYAASMDEGWTRWIFDKYKDRVDPGFSYSSTNDSEIKKGGLRSKYDCIVIPAQSAQQIFNGLSKDRYPSEVSGGLGPDGADALKKFLEDGGTIITLNEASQFAIEHLGAPVKNVLEGVPPKDFYCPGSILKIKVDSASPIVRGAPRLEASSDESIAWVEGSLAFEPRSDDAKVIARFAPANELLLSGWLLGGEKMAGKGAIVEVKRGKGRIIMFAFRPQYRGQSIATLPFFFNAILTSAAD